MVLLNLFSREDSGKESVPKNLVTLVMRGSNNGIINSKNEYDIENKRDELINNKCFDLKDLKGINTYIDNLVGDKIYIDYNYLEYLKRLLRNKYKYDGDITLTRDDLLKIILYKPKKNNKNPILIKKLI